MYLEYEEDGDPLVVGVVDGRVGVGAARAVPLEVLGDVEGAVHPAVVLQRRLTHPSAGLKSGKYTLIWHLTKTVAHRLRELSSPCRRESGCRVHALQ